MSVTDKRGFGKGKPGPGRPKGASNKITKDIKEAIVGAFHEAGGQAYLVKLAHEDPRTFCALVGKVLPMQITGEGGGPMTIQITRYADDTPA